MRTFWTAVVVIALLLVAAVASAHTLQPGECEAYASDAGRFASLRTLGVSADDAQESLRRMLEDGQWFMYVRDHEDVERMRNIVTSIWEAPDAAKPEEIRAAVLNSCDPDNREQFSFPFDSKQIGS